jgi:hypothetical protein
MTPADTRSAEKCTPDAEESIGGGTLCNGAQAARKRTNGIAAHFMWADDARDAQALLLTIRRGY